MLFHEIYSTYFQTVAKILAEAVEHGEIITIIMLAMTIAKEIRLV